MTIAKDPARRPVTDVDAPTETTVAGSQYALNKLPPIPEAMYNPATCQNPQILSIKEPNISWENTLLRI